MFEAIGAMLDVNRPGSCLRRSELARAGQRQEGDFEEGASFYGFHSLTSHIALRAAILSLSFVAHEGCRIFPFLAIRCAVQMPGL